jgi:hypothetical protein
MELPHYLGLALAFACLASLARTPDEVGYMDCRSALISANLRCARARTGLSMALSSVGSLASAPIQGALLTRKFAWIHPIAFSGVSVAGSDSFNIIHSLPSHFFLPAPLFWPWPQFSNPAENRRRQFP